MNCSSVSSRLSAFVDAELTGAEMLLMQEHLRHCDDCAVELEELRSLKRMMSGLFTPEPPKDFENRLMEAVAKRPAVPLLPWGRMVAATGLAATLTWILIANLGQAKPKIEASQSPPSMAFEVKRDQAFVAGTDPMGGSPVMTAGFGGR